MPNRSPKRLVARFTSPEYPVFYALMERFPLRFESGDWRMTYREREMLLGALESLRADICSRSELMADEWEREADAA